MAALLIIFGIPVLFALSVANVNFAKAWTFFCCSVLSFYGAISLLSITIPLTEILLGQKSVWVFLIVFAGVGLLATLILTLLFSKILTDKEIKFPEKYTHLLQFVMGYAGSLLLVVLLVFGMAPLIAKPMPAVTNDLMRIATAVTQKTMLFCQGRMTDHQKLWLRYKPVYLARNIEDAAPAPEEEIAAVKASIFRKWKGIISPKMDYSALPAPGPAAGSEKEKTSELMDKEKFDHPFTSDKK